MSNLSTKDSNPQALIDEWLRREVEGERFPVDFDIAWKLAGYADKGKGKRRLTSKSSYLTENEDYKIEKGDFTRSGKSGACGRSSDLILLTCDAFKHFCLLAETEQGRQIRQHFIESEKKWRLVQQQYPAIASQVEQVSEEMEMLRLKNQNLKLESKIKATELELLKFRHTITATCPELVQQKILGYQTVKEIEYRDRVIYNGQVLKDGETITKTELCRRYSLTTRSGAADYKKLSKYLDALPPQAWENVPSVRDNQELKREYLDVLDNRFYNGGDRQLFLGEGLS